MLGLESSGPFTSLLATAGPSTWEQACAYVANLPYGRSKDRGDLLSVVRDGKGTCSSKHAYLKSVAEENGMDEVELVLCIYKMNSTNTKGIGNSIADTGLDGIPEAHCYLRVQGVRCDYTTAHSDISKIEADILLEQLINPRDVVNRKLEFHHKFLKNWIKNQRISQSFEELWAVREKCIEELSKNQ